MKSRECHSGIIEHYILGGISAAAGRPSSFSHAFDSAYPLARTRYRKLRAKALIPILSGTTWPTPSFWLRPSSRSVLSRYYEISFVPWNPVREAQPIGSQTNALVLQSAETCIGAIMFAKLMLD